ncbi:MAG: nucleotide exchange factor GrpE [Gemmatimonadota bacterium]
MRHDDGDAVAPAAAGDEHQEPVRDGATQGDERSAAGAELQELQDRYLRLAAEYDNFRKRTDRERLDARDRAQAQLVQTLLDSLDDLERVASYDPQATTTENLLEGVRLVERKLAKALEVAGLERVEAQGHRFDPEVHEALMMSPTEEAAEDETVGEVFQSGYRFRGSLLRPARVQVRQHSG